MTRRSAFIQRMQVGWASSKRLRAMGRTNKSLVERLGMMIDIMVPAMLETIVQWGELIRGEEAGKAITVMDNALNDVLNGLSNASALVIPNNMEIALRPAVRPDTITNMANNVVLMNDGIVRVLAQAKHQHAEVEDAAVKGIAMMDASDADSRRKIAELFVTTQKAETLQLEALPELPEATAHYAKTHAAA